MAQTIAAFFVALLSLLFFDTGRHRAPGAARSRRVERREQTRRRRALWLASVGIDNGPRVIHGVRVRAAR
jgi:hypothetical protein